MPGQVAQEPYLSWLVHVDEIGTDDGTAIVILFFIF